MLAELLHRLRVSPGFEPIKLQSVIDASTRTSEGGSPSTVEFGMHG